MTEAIEDRDFLSRSEVAEIFGVSPNTITRWAQAGKIPYIRTLGGHRRYEKKAIGQLANTYFTGGNGLEIAYLFVPQMYGDHWVNPVRTLLMKTDGIQDVWTSPAFQQVKITYDPDVISVEQIVGKLEHAGYSAIDGQSSQGISQHRKDPIWGTSGPRMTQTHRADRRA